MINKIRKSQRGKWFIRILDLYKIFFNKKVYCGGLNLGNEIVK